MIDQTKCKKKHTFGVKFVEQFLKESSKTLTHRHKYNLLNFQDCSNTKWHHGSALLQEKSSRAWHLVKVVHA